MPERKHAHWLWRVVRTIVVGWLAVTLLVWIFQRRLQYLPSPGAVPIPPAAAASGLREVSLTASDGETLAAWHWPGAKDATIAIFHGNAGNRGHRLEWCQDLNRLGYGVFIVDYRGFGGSSGSPTEEGLRRDGEAAWRWLEENSDDRLVLLGESIGGGVAIGLAAEHNPAALILQAPFTSAADVARGVYWFLPVDLLMKDRFENLPLIPAVSCPSLVIHGTADRIIPVGHGERVYAALADPKEWYAVEDAGHNDLLYIGGREYLAAVDRFIERHVLGGGER